MNYLLPKGYNASFILFYNSSFKMSKKGCSKLEEEILSEISLEVPLKLLEEFSKLERVSGTEDERKAANYIAKELERFGIPYQRFEPSFT